MPFADAVENVGKPRLRVNAVELGGLDQRVHGGGAFAAAIRTGKEPVLPAQTDTSQCVLGGVVVDLEPAVLSVGEELRLELHGITQCFGQR